MNSEIRQRCCVVVALLLLSLIEPAAAVGPGFTFQGQLRQSGVPSTGTCDFLFSVYDAAVGGIKYGLTEQIPAVQLQDGVFNVTLNSDEEAPPFGDPFTGRDLWLEIAVRCPAGSGTFSAPFSPRQPLRATPYAQFAASTRLLKAVNGSTAVGQSVLLGDGGEENTGVGLGALLSNETGSGNTAVGAYALGSNQSGFSNTALGWAALGSNETGSENVAIGDGSLASHLTSDTIAVGVGSLRSNTTGSQNTALGTRASFENEVGSGNTAVGYEALHENVASLNTAVGQSALHDNTSGGSNVAVGQAALLMNTTGGGNTALGRSALRQNPTGGENIAVGNNAGVNLTSGSGNIYIGNSGFATESSTTRIGTGQTAAYVAGIFSNMQSGSAVTVVSSGRLGITPSSRRYKQDIRDLDGASEGLYQLRPVAYRYVPEVDPEGRQEYGLIAEEVEEVYPELVTYDAEGRPRTVRYPLLMPMLLNELQKQHQAAERQAAELATLRSEVEALKALCGAQ